MSSFKLLLSFFLLSFLLPAAADVNQYFDHIKQGPDQLYSFLKEMPKGGELHYHLDGGLFAEKMLQFAAAGNYCLQKETFNIKKPGQPCRDGIPAKQVPHSPELYQQALRAWSMKDFVSSQESGHDHFFNTFPKFMPLASDKQAEFLAEILQRAAKENELYLELMILPDNARSAGFAEHITGLNTLEEKKEVLLANKDFHDNIEQTKLEANSILKKARQRLGCHPSSATKACKITVKFQYYVLREQPLNQVFAQALNGFAAAAKSNDLVAINLVQAEDGPLSMRDYRKHMEIFQFLHQSYPQVHIALHAGELSADIVKPSQLKFHIREAILTGNAERIGHGVAITYEDKSEDTLSHMAKQQIAVEVNLSSNRQILSIFGEKHPLRHYLLHQVPVVLSTDDEGVLRTNLTWQYFEAALNHGLDYPALKQINRNALTYSFLPGKSIWKNPKTAERVNECKQFESAACRTFTAKNQKAKLQWLLEKKLQHFEQKY